MNWCEIISPMSRERKQAAKTIMWSIAFVCCFWKYILLLFLKIFIWLHWVLAVGSCRVFITSCRIFDCGAQTLGVAQGLSGSEARGILVLQPRIKPAVSLSLQGRFLTTVPPSLMLYIRLCPPVAGSPASFSLSKVLFLLVWTCASWHLQNQPLFTCKPDTLRI